jgi:hypothetical protein
MGLPENAGLPWSREEEAELVRAFEAGATIAQLARQHGRTLQAIHGHLVKPVGRDTLEELIQGVATRE